MDNTVMLSIEFVKRHPLDAARILERQNPEDVSSFLTEAPPVPSARILEIMDTAIVHQCLDLMDEKSCAAIVAALPMHIAALYLRGMNKSGRESLLTRMPADLKDGLAKILRYPEGTIGSVMDSLVFTVPADLSVRDVLKRLRRQGRHLIDYVYVIDRQNVLVGFVSLRDLMLAGADSAVSSVKRSAQVQLQAGWSIGAARALPGLSELPALPVVDKNGIFLGALEQRTLQRLAVKKAQGQQGDAAWAAGAALGELFWIGLTGMVRGASYALSRED